MIMKKESDLLHSTPCDENSQSRGPGAGRQRRKGSKARTTAIEKEGKQPGVKDEEVPSSCLAVGTDASAVELMTREAGSAGE